MNFDRRLTPARPDLAAAHLRGIVEAKRYADACHQRVCAGTAPLTATPDSAAALDSELLMGEEIAVYEHFGDWAWGQSVLDEYVGYVPTAALGPVGTAPSHIVSFLSTNTYAQPKLKSRPRGALSFGSRVQVLERAEGFARIGAGRWVPGQSLTPLTLPLPDWVGTAEKFLGVPYVWGGRSSSGLDCSALVQLSRQAAGHDCPRDSDMQIDLGHALSRSAEPERGDLIFWDGHVGIMLDGSRLLHANAHHMCVVREPLDVAAARIAEMDGGPVRRHVRLDAKGASG